MQHFTQFWEKYAALIEDHLYKIQTFEIWFCYVGTEQIYKHWILPLTNLRLFEVNQSLNPLTQTWNQVKIKIKTWI